MSVVLPSLVSSTITLAKGMGSLVILSTIRPETCPVCALISIVASNKIIPVNKGRVIALIVSGRLYTPKTFAVLNVRNLYIIFINYDIEIKNAKIVLYRNKNIFLQKYLLDV